MADCRGSAGMISLVANQVKEVRKTVNSWFPYEPIVLIGGSILLTHWAIRVSHSIPGDGPIEGIKRYAFKQIRKIPFVRNKVAEEVAKSEKSIHDEIVSLFTDKNQSCHFIRNLPAKGLQPEDILEKLNAYMDLGHYSWEDGSVSGTVYHGGKELTELSAKVYEISAWTNPLHPDVFPGVCKMEGEIVRMVAELFHGGPESCGSVTSGGTESIILAVKAYRDWGINEKGVSYPEIIVPVTAHAAFDKAIQLLGMKIKKVPIDPISCTVDIKAMRRMITKNTVMLVGSAPAYPHGCIDNIVEVAALGVKYNIPVHVDACLGGFIIAFMSKAGYELPPFDFRVPGVTSISADTHKYGFAPKGSSCLLFRELKYKHFQYFTQSDWPGGLYASPTLAGSRPGALIAGCWAALLFFGTEGYVNSAKKIVSTARYLQEKLNKIPGIYVMGNPEVSVVAIASKEFDIYRMHVGLNKKGWSLNALQFPSCVHFCLTYCQTEDGVADKFLADVRSVVSEIMKHPMEITSGAAAIYGTSQQVPDRSIVEDITAIFLDKLYMTEIPNESNKSNGKA